MCVYLSRSQVLCIYKDRNKIVNGNEKSKFRGRGLDAGRLLRGLSPSKQKPPFMYVSPGCDNMQSAILVLFYGVMVNSIYIKTL